MNNWPEQTIEKLEKNVWGSPPYSSHLVTRTYALRKVPLSEFTTEDLRIMIGQQMSLLLLIPMALDVLAKDLFAAGDFFEGDLLKNVLLVDTGFWNEHKKHWQRLYKLIDGRRSEIAEQKSEISRFDNCKHKPD